MKMEDTEALGWHRLATHLVVVRTRLWHSHCRQMPRAYDVKGATKDGCI